MTTTNSICKESFFFDGIKILRQRKPSILFMTDWPAHVSIKRSDQGIYTVSVCGQVIMTTTTGAVPGQDEYFTLDCRASRSDHFFQTVNRLLSTFNTGLYLKRSRNREDWILCTDDTTGNSSLKR